MRESECYKELGRLTKYRQKRRPEFVMPFAEELRQISETDENRVVRIHCLGAIKAAVSGEKRKGDKP